MSARIVAFFLWAAVAACLAYWGLRVGVAAPPLPASVQPVSTAMVLRGDVMRLFATPAAADAPSPTEPGLASRFKLVGVMAPQAGERGAGEGIALIAVDGKPPRPFRIGSAVDDKLVLQAVARRGATIGPSEGLAAVRLELPPLVPAATGSLPPAPSFSPTAAVPAPPEYPGQFEPPEQSEFVAPPSPDPLAPAPDSGQSAYETDPADNRINRR
ncbi:hypothetical protein [Methylibium sp.]|uniref:hypothetical protein n=1 Tax=Methylibium sp. TaxID=2067992 RepID=UPI0017D84DA8|nr:hypothetical protein [Methylibium sp.]MBA3591084.1 hypothetical protein [Methylibium sp.]